MKVFAVSANGRQIKFSSLNNLASLYCFGLNCLLPSISLLILIFPKTQKQLKLCSVTQKLEWEGVVGRRIPLPPMSETASILQMRTLGWDAANQG